jgi:hypothetical protein
MSILPIMLPMAVAWVGQIRFAAEVTHWPLPASIRQRVLIPARPFRLDRLAFVVVVETSTDLTRPGLRWRRSGHLHGRCFGADRARGGAVAGVVGPAVTTMIRAMLRPAGRSTRWTIGIRTVRSVRR